MNQFNFSRTSNLLQIKATLLQFNPSISSLLHKTLENALIFTRPMSKKPTSIPKNQQRVRDHGFDNYMEIEKKIRKVLKFQDLILTQPHQCLPISRLDFIARRNGFKKDEAGEC